MNALVKLDKTDAAERLDFTAHYAEINGWRGRCIAHFAKVEVTIAIMLVDLSLRSGTASTLPPLSGQRSKELSKLIVAEKVFGKQGKNSLEALKKMADLQSLRNALCHGQSSVLVDADSQWHCLLETIGQKGERHIFHVDAKKATLLEASLERQKHSVCQTLGEVRKQLKDTV